MAKCRLLVDTGFPLGRENQENIGLLQKAAGQGRRILCLREKEESERLYGVRENVCVLPSMGGLMDALAAGPQGGK